MYADRESRYHAFLIAFNASGDPLAFVLSTPRESYSQDNFIWIFPFPEDSKVRKKIGYLNSVCFHEKETRLESGFLIPVSIPHHFTTKFSFPDPSKLRFSLPVLYLDMTLSHLFLEQREIKGRKDSNVIRTSKGCFVGVCLCKICFYLYVCTSVCVNVCHV